MAQRTESVNTLRGSYEESKSQESLEALIIIVKTKLKPIIAQKCQSGLYGSRSFKMFAPHK